MPVTARNRAACNRAARNTATRDRATRDSAPAHRCGGPSWIFAPSLFFLQAILPVTPQPIAHFGPPGSPSGRSSDRGRGLIGADQIREIVSASDMLAIVGESVDLKKSGARSFRGLCPFHTEKTPSFDVTPALHVYHCKGCGAGGDVIKFVRETRGLTFVEAIELLAQRAGIALQREELSPSERQRWDAERSRRAQMLALAQAAQQFFRGRFGAAQGKAAHDYAAGRGLSQAIAVRYGLGAAGTGWTDLSDHLRQLGWAERDLIDMGLAVARESGGIYDRFRNRLMFPIFTAQGDLVAFGGRDLSDDKQTAKYMNSPEVTVAGEEETSRYRHFYKKGDIVFGLYQAREAIRRTGRAILVEGNLDVMTLAQAGFENAICAMGTSLTEVQAHEIRRFTDKVVVIYDGDAAGRKAAHKAVPVLLAAGCNGVAVTLPPAEDPDSLVRVHGAAALQARIDAAPPMLNAFLDQLAAQWDGSLQEKSKILQQTGPLFALIGQHDAMARNMAYDYLIGLLDKDRGLHDGRQAQARYTARPATLMPSVAPAQAVANDAIAPPERELFELAIWYPTVLGQPVLQAAIDVVQHDAIRLALRDLVARHRDRPLSLGDIGGWALQLPHPDLRQLVLDWLGQPPRIQAHEVERELALLVERVARPQALEARLRQVAAELPTATGERLETLRVLFAQLTRLRRGGAHKPSRANNRAAQ